MRTIGLLGVLAVASCLPGEKAWAQTTNPAPAVQATAPGPAVPAPTALAPTAQATTPVVAAQGPAVQTPKKTGVGHAAAEIAGRPDAWRYYWHNGHWWYFTSQNTWLRWNGGAWVPHISINDSGAFSQGNLPQPNTLQPNTLQPNAGSYDNGANVGPSYRYDINRRKGGL